MAICGAIYCCAHWAGQRSVTGLKDRVCARLEQPPLQQRGVAFVLGCLESEIP